MRFLEYLTEAAMARSIIYEWCIVRLCLLESDVPEEEIKRRLKNKGIATGPKIHKMAYASVSRVKWFDRKLIPLVQHADEVGIKGNPSPKTDILFGSNIRVSVKMPGSYQLSSAMGKTTARMFSDIAKEFIQEKLDDDHFLEIFSNTISHYLKQMPYKNIDSEDWAKYYNQTGSMIEKIIVEFLEENQEFYHRLIEEALTGKRTFRRNPMASANYMLSPKRFSKIDDALIAKISLKTKVAISPKSHKGVIWGTVRFRTNEKVSLASFEHLNPRDVFTPETLEKALKNIEFSVTIEIE